MNVTRDVIYDLLPGYFSGDISADSRAFVDQFLEQDPEFRQMMERFRTVFRQPRPAATAESSGDRETFERARAELRRRSELRGYIIAFGLATLFVVIVAVLRSEVHGARGPWFMAVTFLATSLIAWYQLYRLKTQHRR